MHNNKMVRTLDSTEHAYIADIRRPEQLRIAVVSDAEAERNGVGAYYHDLAEQLREHVAAIETFGPSTHNKYRHFILPLLGGSTQRIWFPPLLKIKREIEALQPHVIVVPTPGPYGLLGWHLATRFGARLMVRRIDLTVLQKQCFSGFYSYPQLC